jgi:hypothetical protein
MYLTNIIALRSIIPWVDFASSPGDQWYVRTVIPRFTSLIRSSKIARKAKSRKTKIISHYFPKGITIGLREKGARIRENWVVN